MKRFIAVLAVFALFLCLVPVPAQAAETYVFTYDESLKWPTCDSIVPDGLYDVSLYIVEPDGLFLYTCSVSPVELVFNDPFSESFFVSPIIFYSEQYDDLFECLIVPQTYEGRYYFFFSDGKDDIFDSYEDFAFILTRVEESGSPSLSDVVDTDVLGGVLDQVASLLPVVLVVIVAYIALRKGIRFLRSIMAGA